MTAETPPTDAAGPVAIRYVPLDLLEGADRNAKAHDLATIRASLARFGVAGPVAAINEATGKMVAGHGRVEALRAMAADDDPPPDRVVARDDDPWLVPVVVGVEFTDEAEAEAYLVADNASQMLGGWNTDVLLDTLSEMPDLTGTGYSTDALHEMLSESGRLADEKGGFLDDLAGDQGAPKTPGEGGPVMSPGDAAAAELRLPMSIEDRDTAIRTLRAHKRALGVDTLSAALLAVVETWAPPSADADR